MEMYLIDMDCHPPFGVADIGYIGKVSYKEFFDNLERAGISKVCGTLFLPTGFFDSREISEAIQEVNERTMELACTESRYIPVFRMHPDCIEVTLSQLKKYVPMGMRIFEVEGVWLERTDMLSVFTYMQEQDVVLSIRNATAEQVLTIAENFPSLKIIIDGVMDRVFSPISAKEILSKCPQIYLKVSDMAWIDNYYLHEWSKQLNKGRLLFGTGYPDCNPATRVAAALWELRDCSDEEQKMIFGQNAAKLFEEVSE